MCAVAKLVYVTPAQRDAAKLLVRRSRSTGRPVSSAVHRIAEAEVEQSVGAKTPKQREIFEGSAEADVSVMEEISAPEYVATDRSGASVGDLSVLISGTRDKLTAYLTHARARQRRLLNIAMVASAVATGLTAPLAIGGKDVSDQLSAALGFPIWQLACALVAVCSLLATVATQLLKSQNQRVARAESVQARLGVLDMGRITGSLTPAQVSTEYAAYVELSSLI
jgi:hypothetical protein